VSQLYDEGKYTEALPLAEQYLALARERYGEEHEQFAIAALWLGAVYRAQGRAVDAERFLRLGVRVYEDVLKGADDPRIAKALSNLAGVYGDEGRYTDAEPIYRRYASGEGRLVPVGSIAPSGSD
jgi:tetratricopeptide (TPR) repeat protein